MGGEQREAGKGGVNFRGGRDGPIESAEVGRACRSCTLHRGQVHSPIHPPIFKHRNDQNQRSRKFETEVTGLQSIVVATLHRHKYALSRYVDENTNEGSSPYLAASSEGGHV